jgi:hypothetical protein
MSVFDLSLAFLDLLVDFAVPVAVVCRGGFFALLILAPFALRSTVGSKRRLTDWTRVALIVVVLNVRGAAAGVQSGGAQCARAHSARDTRIVGVEALRAATPRVWGSPLSVSSSSVSISLSVLLSPSSRRRSPFVLITVGFIPDIVVDGHSKVLLLAGVSITGVSITGVSVVGFSITVVGFSVSVVGFSVSVAGVSVAGAGVSVVGFCGIAASDFWVIDDIGVLY